MTNFWRSLFGLNGAAGDRTVVGTPEGIEVKDVHYIKDSKKRLTALQELHNRYSGTLHADKIEAVYHKTKEIHSYLIDRRRVHELELFHLQHTDHFLNTFTVIIDAHQQHYAKAAALKRAAARADGIIRKVASVTFRKDRKEVKAALQANRETSERAFADLNEAKLEVPGLTIPQISINTYSKIVYLRENISGGLVSNEIGFTSSPEEKEAFIDYVSERFGIDSLAYLGNAMVFIPTHNTSPPAEMIPVIHWNGSPYALILEDCHLFPVRTYRKSR
ncbi:hypothetical protein [Pontibacter pamirensis]|uniref:hypothetical protein n=1 Tax=Pontibacter pamirensis TaxID=2562824 RepID=UPI001389AC97|nr:hypothetical protein [Pontibacter pamirensis]